VKTQYGWHIIKLEETRDVDAPAFDQVKQRLEQMVLAKKFKAHTDELLKTAKVDKPAQPEAAKPAAGDSGAAGKPAEPAKSSGG
jgi:peptidyl-prolyl cis-trans isomerase C